MEQKINKLYIKKIKQKKQTLLSKKLKRGLSIFLDILKNEKKIKTNKYSFPVDEKKYLLNFLTPTSPGTNYWEPPPSGKPNKRQFGRILLQIHQLTFLKIIKN